MCVRYGTGIGIGTGTSVGVMIRSKRFGTDERCDKVRTV